MLKHAASVVLASLKASTWKHNPSEGFYPFPKNHYIGERLTRSAVCTSSAIHSLRPCLGQGASRRARAGRV